MKELHWAINEERAGARVQSEEGPARLQGVALTSPAIKSVCKLFLAFVDGAQRKTASPVLIDLPSVMTTPTADMIHWRPSPLPHQVEKIHPRTGFASQSKLCCCYHKLKIKHLNILFSYMGWYFKIAQANTFLILSLLSCWWSSGLLCCLAMWCYGMDRR